MCRSTTDICTRTCSGSSTFGRGLTRNLISSVRRWTAVSHRTSSAQSVSSTSSAQSDVASWSHTEPHQLEATRIERHEAQDARPLELRLFDGAVQPPVLDADSERQTDKSVPETTRFVSLSGTPPNVNPVDEPRCGSTLRS